MSRKYTYEEVKKEIESRGYKLLSEEYKGVQDKLLCKNEEGYYVYIQFGHFMNRHDTPYIYHKSNDYTIWNINHYAELHGIKTRCVSDKYIKHNSLLHFKCECGNDFYTTRSSFIDSGKTMCDKCTGYNTRLSFEEVKNNLLSKGYYVDYPTCKEEYRGVTLTKLLCHDDEGYKYRVIYDHVMRDNKHFRWNQSNPFSIDNINRYLEIKNAPFVCISDKYINDESDLEFVCIRCGEHITCSWQNVNRNDNHNRTIVGCPYCDGRTESLHALVLKQMFLHEYSDTVVEDKSFVNPKTGHIAPTDIVNHRLKIAIEIQSQWHDLKSKKEIDLAKKNYWLDLGYSFYDPDIRDYSVLEVCQLFFNIDELPEYINYKYSNKLNIKKIQQMLDSGKNVTQICNELNINSHRIYDAVGSKKLFYPSNYSRADYTPVVQYDVNWNKIAEYPTIKSAAESNGFIPGSLSSALLKGRTAFKGYNWKKKRELDIHSSQETAG